MIYWLVPHVSSSYMASTWSFLQLTPAVQTNYKIWFQRCTKRIQEGIAAIFYHSHSSPLYFWNSQRAICQISSQNPPLPSLHVFLSPSSGGGNLYWSYASEYPLLLHVLYGNPVFDLTKLRGTRSKMKKIARNKIFTVILEARVKGF